MKHKMDKRMERRNQQLLERQREKGERLSPAKEAERAERAKRRLLEREKREEQKALSGLDHYGMF